MDAQEYYEELKMNHPSPIFEGDDIIRAFDAGKEAALQEIIDCFPNSLCINPNEVLGTIAERINDLKAL